MIRKIIRIDGEKCNGCGLCVRTCHERAIGMVDGKARLLQDDYCEGLGDCLPVCPTGAITFEEREAAEYVAVAGARQLQTECLSYWPVQIRLVPARASFLSNAHLLIAADCAAYAHGSFHETFMRDRVTLIGCPKLDDTDYSEKLTAILKINTIRSVTVARMESSCCVGLENAVKTALRKCGKTTPLQGVWALDPKDGAVKLPPLFST